MKSVSPGICSYFYWVNPFKQIIIVDYLILIRNRHKEWKSQSNILKFCLIKAEYSKERSRLVILFYLFLFSDRQKVRSEIHILEKENKELKKLLGKHLGQSKVVCCQFTPNFIHPYSYEYLSGQSLILSNFTLPFYWTSHIILQCSKNFRKIIPWFPL